jgi:excisionase family DNA binding protein
MPKLGRYSVSKAAEVTGIPRRTIIHAITTGKLKAHKLSDAATSAYVIDVHDLDAFLDQKGAAS